MQARPKAIISEDRSATQALNSPLFPFIQKELAEQSQNIIQHRSEENAIQHAATESGVNVAALREVMQRTSADVVQVLQRFDARRAARLRENCAISAVARCRRKSRANRGL